MAYDPSYARSLPLAFVDVETGGIDPATCALLSVAVVKTDPFAEKVLASYSSKIIPYAGLEITREAAAVNGWTPESWADATAENAVLPNVAQIIQGCAWVGASPRFDIDFLTAAFKRWGRQLSFGWRYPIDTTNLAWPMLKAGLISDCKLATVARALGEEQKVPHTAADDVDLTVRVYRRLMAGYIASVARPAIAEGMPS
jgi:DNA polymerase III alpha subunit (gram-positive type)